MLNEIVELGADPAVYRKNKVLLLFVNGHFHIVTEPIAVHPSIIAPKFDLVNLVQVDDILHREFIYLTTFEIVPEKIVQLGCFRLLALVIV